MVAALTSVDVGDELLSFFRRYAPQRDPIGADAIQVVFLHAVAFGLASYAFCFRIILGDPAGGLRHKCEKKACT